MDNGKASRALRVGLSATQVAYQEQDLALKCVMGAEGDLKKANDALNHSSTVLRDRINSLFDPSLALADLSELSERDRVELEVILGILGSDTMSPVLLTGEMFERCNDLLEDIKRKYAEGMFVEFYDPDPAYHGRVAMIGQVNDVPRPNVFLSKIGGQYVLLDSDDKRFKLVLYPSEIIDKLKTTPKGDVQRLQGEAEILKFLETLSAQDPVAFTALLTKADWDELFAANPDLAQMLASKADVIRGYLVRNIANILHERAVRLTHYNVKNMTILQQLADSVDPDGNDRKAHSYHSLSEALLEASDVRERFINRFGEILDLEQIFDAAKEQFRNRVVGVINEALMAFTGSALPKL